MLRKLGKVGKNNQKANAKLHQMWIDKDIRRCEAGEILFNEGIIGCRCAYMMTNAHRHKRVWYRSCPDKLYEWKQVIRICQHCHDAIEYSPELTKKVFMILRGEE